MRSSLEKVLAALLVALAPSAALAEDAADMFQKRCTSCHTIGGGALTGPDLKDVGKRAERGFLVVFVQNPQALVERGEPYVQKLVKEARGVVMPKIEGMTPERALELLDLIEAESKLEKSRFKGNVVSERPLTASDLARGRALFTGRSRLKSGGPACMGCHRLGGLGGLGGGTLGGDLGEAYGELGGRKGLASAIATPAKPVMERLYAQHPLDGEEVLALVALIKDAAERREAPDQGDAANLVALAIAGVAGLLVLVERLFGPRPGAPLPSLAAAGAAAGDELVHAGPAPAVKPETEA